MSLQTPEGVSYGLVIGRWIQIVGDTPDDPDKLPDTKPISGSVGFTRKVKTTIREDTTQEDGSYVGIAKQSITGYLRTVDGELAVSVDNDTTGLWLVTGVYTVVFTLSGTTWPSFDIEVTEAHTLETPLDLISASPYVAPVGANPVVIMVPASIPDGHLLVKEGSSVTGLDPANLGGPGGGATDHGALSGLEDDDHKQYALADGSRGSFAPPLGADDNYVTDAQLAALHSHTNKTALDQVSGVNTGDQDLSGLVPNTRTVNGKPLSANVTLNASDVGAATPQQVTDGDTATLSAAQSHAQALVDALTAASPATLDTLAEIAAALGADPNFAATMTAALAARVRFDAAQSLTVGEQAQARSNIGAGTSSFTGDYADLTGKPTLGTAAATAATDYATAAQGAKADAAIPSGLVDAKGDLIVATADGAVTRLPAGTNGHVLTADSAQAAGVKWVAPSGGGGGVADVGYVPSAAGLFTTPNGTGVGPESSIGPIGASSSPYIHHYTPTWQATASFKITAVRLVVPGAIAGNTVRVVLVEMDSDDQPLSVIEDFGTIDASSTGDKDITGLTCPVQGGHWYAFCVVRYGGGGSIILRAWPVSYGHFGQHPSVANRIAVVRYVSSAASGPSTPLTSAPDWTTRDGAAGNATPGPLEYVLVQRGPA